MLHFTKPYCAVFDIEIYKWVDGMSKNHHIEIFIINTKAILKKAALTTNCSSKYSS